MSKYLQVKNGETLQEGYSEEDYSQVLAEDPYYVEVTENRDKAIEAFARGINEPLKAPF